MSNGFILPGQCHPLWTKLPLPKPPLSGATVHLFHIAKLFLAWDDFSSLLLSLWEVLLAKTLDNVLLLLACEGVVWSVRSAEALGGSTLYLRHLLPSLRALAYRHLQSPLRMQPSKYLQDRLWQSKETPFHPVRFVNTLLFLPSSYLPPRRACFPRRRSCHTFVLKRVLKTDFPLRLKNENSYSNDMVNSEKIPRIQKQCQLLLGYPG